MGLHQRFDVLRKGLHAMICWGLLGQGTHDLHHRSEAQIVARDLQKGGLAEAE